MQCSVVEDIPPINKWGLAWTAGVLWPAPEYTTNDAKSYTAAIPVSAKALKLEQPAHAQATSVIITTCCII